MEPQCYAQRLLNPFRGVMQVIRYQSAEAVTLDGQRWDLYVSNAELLDGIAPSSHAQVSDIRYGSWTAEQGLKRGPIYPSEDFFRMEQLGAVVYEHLLRVHRSVPFPLRDHYELWLLDTADQPLALLHSAVSEHDIDCDAPIDWRAGSLAQRQFRSTAADHCDAADQLTRDINRRAGNRPAAQWFQRHDDGSGTGLHGIALDPALRARSLGAAAFPAHFVAPGSLPATRQLIADFGDWLAPWLLLLPQADARTRQHLERCARSRALVLDRNHRLYPRDVDPDLLRVARVEALMRRAQGDTEHGDAVPSPFYIEMNPRGAA